MAIWVRAHVRLYGICDGQSGTAAGFLRVLRFPLTIRIPPIAPQSSSSSSFTSIIWGWYNRPNSVRSTKWTQSHHIKNINNLQGSVKGAVSCVPVECWHATLSLL
jgi:hypothetical protein